MKGVLDIFYKWCGALHRGADKRVWHVLYNSNIQIDFVGGIVKVTNRSGTPPRTTTTTYTYVGDGIETQTVTHAANNRNIVTFVKTVSCRSLVINGEVFI